MFIYNIVFAVVDIEIAVTIVSSPPGTPVIGSANTYDYPILSSVFLTCVMYPIPSEFVTYQWNTEGCYVNDDDERWCFPAGKTAETVRVNNLLAKDAGTITCTATVHGENYTSDNFTLRISGMD